VRACRLARVDPLFHLFASYRHEDDVGHVGRALDHLRQRFRIGAVLQDVGLPPGTPLESLLHMVRTSRLVLAFIGPHWAVGPAGALRFDDEGDWVRREIATAIAGNIPLLPVRLPNARVPSPQELPADVRPVVGITAAKLDSDDWPYYIGKLTSAAESYVAPAAGVLHRDQATDSWWGRIHAGRALAGQLLIDAIGSALHVHSSQFDAAPWSQLTALVNADHRSSETVIASLFPTRLDQITKGFMKTMTFTRHVTEGPMYVGVSSWPTMFWDGWDQRNRYNVNAVVARLWQLAAQAGVAVESNAVTPLGGPVYNFEPL
jgi:hypothetical protein